MGEPGGFIRHYLGLGTFGRNRREQSSVLQLTGYDLNCSYFYFLSMANRCDRIPT